MTPAERSVLEKIRASAGDAEVICIVRPIKDPHAMSEIVVVDRASQDLLRQLASERRTQTTKRLTSFESKPGAAPAATAPRCADILDAARTWQPNAGSPQLR